MTRVRTGAVLCGLAMLAVLAPTRAQAQSDLDAARKRLVALESSINGGQASVRRLQTQMRSLAADVSRESGNLAEVRNNLGATKAKLAETKGRLTSLQGQIHLRAQEMYKRGPVHVLGIVLGSENLSDFVGRVTYVGRIVRRDSQLVLETRRIEAELEGLRAHQEQLERTQANTVTTLQARQDALTEVFAQQQAELAKLASAKAEALRLIGQLEAQLGDLGRLRRVAGTGMTISYGEWAESFLATLGAPVVRSNLVVVVAWEAAEGTQATWNPLATTMPMPGATTYNSHGVRNYSSKEEGIQASILTLRRPNHGYEAILDSLERGAEAMETGRAIQQSDWCRGCAEGGYVVNLIPAVERYYDRYAGR